MTWVADQNGRCVDCKYLAPLISEPSGSHHTVKMPQTLLGKGYLTAG